MRCWVRKIRAGNIDRSVFVLAPAGAVDEEAFEKWRTDIDLRADVVQPRNPGLHRKAFALLNLVFPHTNYPTVERLRVAMTVGAGFVDEVINPMNGNVVWYPKSWAFDSMDDVEFQELYNRLVDVALKIVPRSKRDDWEDAVDQIVRF